MGATFRKDDLAKALAAAIASGLTPRRFRITPDGAIEVDCDRPEAVMPIDLVDWKR